MPDNSHPQRIPRYLLAALVLLIAACATAGDEQGEPQTGLETVDLTVADTPLTAEIADTHEKRQKGLMYREDLPEDRGMLFVYPRAYQLSFWMKNTPLPLDIAFIDATGFIVDIQAMAPHDTNNHRAPSPVPYALEVHQGWFEENDVTVGDRVTGLPETDTAE